MKKKFFSSLLAALILFWAVGMTSYSQEKTEKASTKTEKVEKKTSMKTNVKKEKTSKVSVASKDKMIHKHHMKSAKMYKEMKGKRKTDSKENEKSK